MDKLYTIQEVATKLNLSDKTLRRWEDAGRFTPSRTLGNQRRYTLEDLQILDAIKHGTINEQKDLLTVDQAGKLCGVSPTTIIRWEDAGKIHPLITSGNTYYPRQKLIEKMEELKKIPTERNIKRAARTFEPSTDPEQYEETLKPKGEAKIPELNESDLKKSIEPRRYNGGESLLTLQDTNAQTNNTGLTSYITNILITLVIILSYHLLFNGSPSSLISPQSTTTQSTSSISDPTFDLLKTILDPSGALTTTTLTSKLGLVSPKISLTPSTPPVKPTPGTIYYDATSQSLKIFKSSGWTELSLTSNLKMGDVTLVSSSGILGKGQNQISVTQPQIKPSTPVTVTFVSDYAPAKKYWVTTDQGSFTLHTDFPVSADSPFNYNFVAPTSTTSATTTF